MDHTEDMCSYVKYPNGDLAVHFCDDKIVGLKYQIHMRRQEFHWRPKNYIIRVACYKKQAAHSVRGGRWTGNKSLIGYGLANK